MCSKLTLHVFVLMLLSSTNNALDPLVASNGQFVNRLTNNTYRSLGIVYQPSNDTSGLSDALSDPDACLRDAALYQQLGINHLGVLYLGEASHDECMSIFNSVGIYVSIALDEFREIPWIGDFHLSYNDPEFMRRIFRLVDAFKDYENLAAISVTGTYAVADFSGLAQPYIRALVRDVRRYISRHSDRKDIPIGFSRDFTFLSSPTFVMKTSHLQYALDYARCRIPEEPDDASMIDFFSSGLREVIFENESQYDHSGDGIHYKTFRDLDSQGTPVFIQQYRQMVQSPESTELPLVTDNFSITRTLYSDVSLRNKLSGTLVSSWANFVSDERGQMDNGLVELDKLGNLRIRPAYENSKRTIDQMNLAELMNGPKVLDTTFVTTCTSAVSEVYDWNGEVWSTMTFNNSWTLPTALPEVMAMIESGVNGPRGSHVDITETLVRHTVYDVHGNVMSSLAITPSPSSPRSTPSISADGQTEVKDDLALKVGLAIGVPLATIAMIVVGLFLLRRKRNRTHLSNLRTETVGQSEHSWQKPELEDRTHLSELDGATIGVELGDSHAPSMSELQGTCIMELHDKSRIP